VVFEISGKRPIFRIVILVDITRFGSTTNKESCTILDPSFDRTDPSTSHTLSRSKKGSN
jgi:hypothetical protein